MVPVRFLPRFIGTLMLLCALMPASMAFGEDDLSDLQQRIDRLQNEAAQTSDLSRLMEIAAELGNLSTQVQNASGAVPGLSFERGKTPEEEIDREILAINSSYEQQKLATAGYTDADAPEIPFVRARKLFGSSEVQGSNQRLPSEGLYDGGVSRTLQYVIKEDFVGYLTITEYFDPKTGKFTDKRDYGVRTISQKIPAPTFGGRECLETVGNDRKVCKRWEPYASYKLAGGDTYPAIHDWAVLGSPDDDGVMLEVETPDIIFATAHNSENRSQGCFGAEIFLPNVDFSQDIQDDRLAVKKSVGGEFGGTPHCAKGSTVSLDFELCAEVPPCEQLQSLLENIFWAIDSRDLYREKAKQADSVEQLELLVKEELERRYPAFDSQDKKYLQENAGNYQFTSGAIKVPDLCKGCAAMPLCRWNMEGLRIHEKTHQMDGLADPQLRKLFFDTQYQMENFTANELERVQTRVVGDLEYHAYDENARHLMDILQLELSRNTGCPFPAKFYLDLDRARQLLK